MKTFTGNGLLFQGFEWEVAADSQHWRRLQAAAPQLKAIGVTGIWIPPAMKATSVADTGYSSYDLYDIGEFDQKGSVATKYGTAAELEDMIRSFHELEIGVYADIVLNHKAGADETERFPAVKVDPQDRTKEIAEPAIIAGWTHFTFPGRAGQYSPFEWTHDHFSAVDRNEDTGEIAIFRILGENKGFSAEVDPEYGNYDYLMHANIDMAHPDVQQELFDWGVWYLSRFGFDGMRFDAVKHIDFSFMRKFVKEMRRRVRPDLYAVGEYWTYDTPRMQDYLEDMRFYMDLFDVALHFNFERASKEGAAYDLRTIFDNSLVADNPLNVVTFVDNHDSQPGQALESWVQDWFKPLAYALILLRRDGYPCLFYGDYYGIAGGPGREAQLDPLLFARQHFAYGEQEDGFDEASLLSFVRLGTAEQPGSGLVCLLSNAKAAEKEIAFPLADPGTVFVDLTGQRGEEVVLDQERTGRFSVAAGSVSVWVRKEALARLRGGQGQSE